MYFFFLPNNELSLVPHRDVSGVLVFILRTGLMRTVRWREKPGVLQLLKEMLKCCRKAKKMVHREAALSAGT